MLLSPSVNVNGKQWNPDQRPARLVSKRDDVYHIDDVRWGFREGGGDDADHAEAIFSDARVDAGQVKEVYMCIEPFEPEWLAAHAFLVFEFEAESPMRNREGQTDSSLVVSVEARIFKAEPYDFIRGLQRTYHIIYQLGTWKDSVQKRCRIEGHRLRRLRLDLTSEQKHGLLIDALENAVKSRPDEFYNTLTDSCFSTVVYLLNGVLTDDQKIPVWIGKVHNVVDASLPTYSDVLLQHHHLILAPPVVTQPDRVRYPDHQSSPTLVGTAIKHASDTPFWKPGLKLAGSALGGALGKRLLPRWPLAAVISGWLGMVVAGEAADLMGLRTHTVYEPCEKYL